MCHEPDARPPYPPIAGGAASGELITLEASDGNRFAAFDARAEHPSDVGMVVLPDVRGLYRFYEELALRFAEIGVNAVAMDYFGRSDGASRRDDSFDALWRISLTTRDGVVADTRACVEHLRSGGAERIFTIGFCFGGRASFNQAAEGHGLAGVIGFYGVVSFAPGTLPANVTASATRGGQAAYFSSPSEAPVSMAKDYACPVVGLFGGADPIIPGESIAEFEQALKTAGVPSEITTYDGLPHSFFDRSFDKHAAACEDAWNRITRFIGLS